MKYLIFTLATFLIIGCNTDPRKDLPATGNYGTAVKEENVVTVNDVLTKLATQNEFEVTVTGLIKEYCKHEGCWLTLENTGGEPLFVEVENKLFVLPHHIEGKVTVITGKASTSTNDAGKKEAKILASGILIK
ncbi:MAG: DUF4920 domain-containing protein [Bacteroidota bacterium]